MRELVAARNATRCHVTVHHQPSPQPQLTDDVIVLRPWRSTDALWLCEVCQDPDIQRWTRVPVPYAMSDATSFIDDLAPTTWRNGTAAHFAVTDAASGRGLGAVGLVAVDRDASCAEIGYYLASFERGRGVATRAVVLIADWALSDLGLDRLEIHVDPRNTPSAAVAERSGFHAEQVLAQGSDPRAERHDTVVFVRVD